MAKLSADWFPVWAALMFLTGWFVCWIQEQPKLKNLKLQVSASRQLQSNYLKLQEHYQSRERLLESLFLEVKRGKLTFPEKVELAEYESQMWQSGYPQVADPDTSAK